MSMFPIDAQHGFSLPRQNSISAERVGRRQSRSIKAIFRRPSGFARRGSKVAPPRTNSLVTGEIDPQSQTTFFARLPLEIRWQIYEELIGEDIHHFRTSKYLYHFRCPRGTSINKAQRLVTMECDLGHPWIERPQSIKDARENPSKDPETKNALMQTCKLAYSETLDLLYRRTKFAFSSVEPLLMLGKTISPAAIERMLLVELRAPDLLVWSYRVAHPHNNRAGINEWMDGLALLQRMSSLRSLYVIVPNAYAGFQNPPRQHELLVERDFLGRFSDRISVPDFVVWIAWYEHSGEEDPQEDTEAGKYTFKVIRFPSSTKWPRTLLREDETENHSVRAESA